MTAPHDDQNRDEVIVPVRPGLRRGGETRSPARRGRAGLVAAAAGCVLLALVYGVVFVLPDIVEKRVEKRVEQGAAPRVEQQAVTGRPANEAPPAPAEPTLTADERAELEARAERLLADLLTQRDRLEDRSVESWGGEDWARYEMLARDGDDAFLADDFAAAVEAYADARDVGDALLERSEQLVASALATGRTAFEAGNPALAVEQLDLVLDIEPEHAAAARLRARAERLPDVLENMRRGDELREAGDIEAARTAYEAALEVDPDWAAAREALAAVARSERERRFQRLLSQGFAALADSDYDAARARFEAALELRPESDEAGDGLAEAEARAQLDRIALAEVRAAAFESRELWQRAVEQYEAALATDPTLAFAIDGLDRARRRADLDAKLERLIDEPVLLLDDGTLADAQRVLADARAVEAPGQRLRGQIDELEALIGLATTPVTVELVSDGMTDVTVYRVGPLGRFAATEIEIRPGRYTIVGSRSGYRDVRETITVLPGESAGPVRVVCVEPI